MPSDIRSFFGGKPTPPAPTKPSKKDDSAKKQTRGKRKIISESDDDNGKESYVVEFVDVVNANMPISVPNLLLLKNPLRRSLRKFIHALDSIIGELTRCFAVEM